MAESFFDTFAVSKEKPRTPFTEYHTPLPQEEVKLLLSASFQSALMLFGATIVIAYIFLAVSSGSLAEPFTSLSIITFFTNQLMPPDMATHWWGFILAPAFMLAAYVCLDIEMKKSLKSYADDKMQLYQGLTGELGCLDKKYFPVVAFLNIFEELLFRGTIIPICLAIAAFVGLSGYPASMFALVVSVILFWLIHMDYRNKTSIITTIFGGTLLGMFYLMWGSLIICWLAHIVYNFYVLTREFRNACEDPDFFGGKQPTTILMDMEAEAKAKKAAKKAE